VERDAWRGAFDALTQLTDARRAAEAEAQPREGIYVLSSIFVLVGFVFNLAPSLCRSMTVWDYRPRIRNKAKERKICCRIVTVCYTLGSRPPIIKD
jgi:hypothetical protein